VFPWAVLQIMDMWISLTHPIPPIHTHTQFSEAISAALTAPVQKPKPAEVRMGSTNSMYTVLVWRWLCFIQLWPMRLFALTHAIDLQAGGVLHCNTTSLVHWVGTEAQGASLGFRKAYQFWEALYSTVHHHSASVEYRAWQLCVNVLVRNVGPYAGVVKATTCYLWIILWAGINNS